METLTKNKLLKSLTEVVENLFKEEAPKDLRERLRAGGYEAACTELKREPLTLEKFKLLYHDEKDAQAFFSLHRITTFIKALKGERKFDWNDNNEKKQYPWWNMDAGSGFSLGGVGYGRTHTDVGARLSSFSDADVRLVTEVMKDDYKIWMNE